MHTSVVLLCTLLARTAVPSPTSDYIEHERRDAPLDNTLLKRADGSTEVTLRIALNQRSLELGEAYLHDVSHQSSPRYGQHWSAQQVQDMLDPSEEAKTTLLEWLADATIRDVAVHNGWISAALPLSTVEKLLLGVFEALSYYNQSDLDLWFARFASFVPDGTHPTLQSVERAKVNQSASTLDRVESHADLTVLYSLLYPNTVNLYQATVATAQDITANDELSVALGNLLAAFVVY